MKKSEEIALHKQIRGQFQYDRLKMYFCEDYTTQNGIVIREPRIGEILQVGEEDFYRNLNIWITNTTSYRSVLWKMDIDWCKFTDFELFCNLYKAINPETNLLLFPDFDLSSYQPMSHLLNPDDDEEPQYELVLYSEENDNYINYVSYLEISQYLRTLFNIFPKDEFAKGRATKEALIWEDEEKANKDEPYKSSLYPLVSSCINHPGFKHSLMDLKNVGIFEFMDSVNRLQVYENTRALLQGSMSGFADMSKVDRENFNFMRDIYSTTTDTKKQDKNTFESVVNDYGKNQKN